jgi:hypothetical protein
VESLPCIVGRQIFFEPPSLEFLRGLCGIFASFAVKLLMSYPNQIKTLTARVAKTPERTQRLRSELVSLFCAIPTSPCTDRAKLL